MSTDGFGHFFIRDDEEPDQAPVAVPVDDRTPGQAPTPVAVPAEEPVMPAAVTSAPIPEPIEPERQPPAPGAGLAEVMKPSIATPVVSESTPAVPAARAVDSGSREHRLAEVLDKLMADAPQIDAAALVSLDGFTMASALPEGMQEDRVGAMSAAILGLGERAAAELGKGRLSQVFIEGEQGYVMLIAAGDRAVLTCLAGSDAKLGLMLYDMQDAANDIAAILS